MELNMDVTGIDMNDSANLEFFTQLIRFQMSPSMEETSFQSPNPSQQRTIQLWAHGLGFDFEYSSAKRTAKVVRTVCPAPSIFPTGGDVDFFDIYPSAVTLGTPEIPLDTITFSNMSENLDDEQDLNLFVDLLQGSTSGVEPSVQLQALLLREASDKGTQTHPCSDQHRHQKRVGDKGARRQRTEYMSKLEEIVKDHEWAIDDLKETNRILEQILFDKGIDVFAELQARAGDPQNGPLPMSKRTADPNTEIDCQFSMSNHLNCADPEDDEPPFGSSLEKSNIFDSTHQLQTLFDMHRHTDLDGQVMTSTVVQSERTRKLVENTFASQSSINQSHANSTYQEIIFDAGSSRVGSPVSASSGRRGPLGSAARVAMNAVKIIRACWRCKFLRKTCDVDSPCLACPKKSSQSGNSNWRSVGCKRGSLKEEMPPLHLCPASDLNIFLPMLSKTESLETLNKQYRDQIDQRDRTIRNMVATVNPNEDFIDVYLQSSSIDQNFRETDQRNFVPIKSSLLPATFTPLGECIAAIIFEVNSCKAPEFAVMKNLVYEKIVLLRAAAQYQAITESDELIAQSLVCLRNSLEAVRIMEIRYSGDTHRTCTISKCKVECIANLNQNIEQYQDELSRVFFHKENMRTKHSWWLSAFYSFCIQGIVRKALKRLLYVHSHEKSFDEYLHLALRLFVAGSGQYDPLMRDFASLAKESNIEPTLVAEFRTAQMVVQQLSWSTNGITSSGQYLKHLFQDRGGDLLSGVRPKMPATRRDSSCSPTMQSNEGQFVRRRRSTSGSYRASSLSSMESISYGAPSGVPTSPRLSFGHRIY